MLTVPVTQFTPLQSLAGGMLIGLAATLLMLIHGRVAGITGILAGLLPPAAAPEWSWRAAFLAGMVASPLLVVGLFGLPVAYQTVTSPMGMVVSGVIVGIGVTFGSGCTSGHGICGLSRFSVRSLVATLVFMASTAVTVFVVRHVLGG
jgi:uncharacterized membrane protein YedE/YeeE